MLIHHTLRMCYLYHGSGLARHGIKLWLHLSLCKWGPHKAYIQLLCCCSANSAKVSFLESLANFILHFRYVECWYFSLSQLLRHSVPHPFSTVCVHPAFPVTVLLAKVNMLSACSVTKSTNMWTSKQTLVWPEQPWSPVHCSNTCIPGMGSMALSQILQQYTTISYILSCFNVMLEL